MLIETLLHWERL